jgi:hypothetical protein
MPTYSGSANISATASSVIEGLFFEATPVGIKFARKYVGEQNVPQDIKRLRRQVYDVMRQMETPVLVKHMWNARDVREGVAVRSENFDTAYGQTRHRDPLSHGVGFVSAEKADNEWVMPDGTLVRADSQPTAGANPAPKYRGFGPGFLLYLIEPDAAEDMFKVGEAGALIKVQQAQAQAPWFPEINDNDLIINVEIDGTGNILKTHERYQAKMTNPVSIRGFGDRRGRREYTEDGGNRYVINQSFEMSLIPPDNALHAVETDR